MAESNNLTNIKSKLYDLNEIICKKYKNRLIEPTDLTPIEINCDLSGPLFVNGGSIMCDKCGSVIRQGYLTNHRNSGACNRLVEKRQCKEKSRKKKAKSFDMLPINTGYVGPRVRLTFDNENLQENTA